MTTTLITPVGTSLFENYIDEGVGNGSIAQHYDRIRNEPGGRWTDRKQQIERIQQDRDLPIWIEATADASAEIESVRKIAAQADGPLTAHLLASDTIESRLAAVLIKDCADVDSVEFTFNEENDQIPRLQVFDDDAFTDGVRNLVRRVRRILRENGELMGQESGGTCAINITGGYKATLPYLTVLGEIYDVPLHYKFEDADGLLSIPQLPITLDEGLFRKHEEELAALNDEGVADWDAFKEEHNAFARRARELIEVADNMALLSPLGELFWGYYTDQYVFFYAPDAVYEAIRTEQRNVRRILRTKSEQVRREAQMEMKGGHRVFDDGDNPYRIYYFVEDDDLHVYNTFEDHDAHESYYENTTFDDKLRRDVMRRSRRRRLKREAS